MTATASGTRRTLLALIASGLGVLPLKALLSDSSWLVQAWLAMIVVLLPAALLRLRRPPGALDIWPGIILLVPFLTAAYVPHHAWGGLIPSGRTFSDVGTLMNSLHRTTSDEVAPIHSTVAVRLVMCALLGLLAALVDLIAVVGRRGALAGVPLLVVYTVSGAVPRTPVAWFWFAGAAAGYLILLALDADDELHAWGRRVSRPGSERGRAGVGVSAQRVGIVAVAVAIVVPFLVPDHPRNLIADAFHDSGGGGLGSFGAGPGGGSGGISPFAVLKGQLTHNKATPLLTVHIAADAPVQPFYARSNVLDKYTGSGWVVSTHGPTESLDATSYGTLPPTDAVETTTYQAQVTVTGLSGNAPVFTVPQGVVGLGPGARWSGQDQLLLGTSIKKGDTYTEIVAQAQPTAAELDQAPAVSTAAAGRWLALPAVPKFVHDLVAQITAGKQSPYAKARAISDWFADPSNEFSYSLKTTKGDSGNDLVDFLQKRTGFCQQYAAAMGVMLRLAGVPSRVVLGYMHPTPDLDHNFKITTLDAHAWVEAYFPGAGWVPFDPTPTAGLVGGKKTDLAWAPHTYVSNQGLNAPHQTAPAPVRRSTAAAGPSQAATGPGAGGGGTNLSGLWVAIGMLMVLLLVLTPAAVRTTRRRRRFAAGRRGDPDALWDELRDSAVDLGHSWSPSRTPRQVVAWLGAELSSNAHELAALAAAVEQRRYAAEAEPRDPATLVRGVQKLLGELRARRRRGIRMRAGLWPASLGWSRRWSHRLTRLRPRGRHTITELGANLS